MSHDPPKKDTPPPVSKVTDEETFPARIPTQEMGTYGSIDAPIASRLTPLADLEVYELGYPGSQQERLPFTPIPVAVELEVASDLLIWVKGTDPKGRQFLDDIVNPMRVSFFQKWGVWIPSVCVSIHNKWPAGTFQISLFDVPVMMGMARRDHLLVAEQPKRLELLGVSPEPAHHPVWERPASWVHRQHSHFFTEDTFTTWDCGEYLSLLLSTTALAHSYEFVGIQEVKTMLSKLEMEWPDLVTECLSALPLPQLRRVLRTLAEEHVTLFPLRHILEILLDETETTQDTHTLVDRVRHKLQRHLCHRHAENYQLLSYLLSPSFEAELHQQFLTQQSQEPLAMEAVMQRRQVWEQLLTTIDKHLSMIPAESTVAPIIIVQNNEIRRPLQRLIRARFPWLDVLFVGEIDRNFRIIPIATLEQPTD